MLNLTLNDTIITLYTPILIIADQTKNIKN